MRQTLYKCEHTLARVHSLTNTHTYKHTIHARTHSHTHIQIHTHTHMHTNTHTHARTHVYIYIHKFMHAHTNTHRNCLRLAFMDLIQNELDQTVGEWNSHYVRKQRHLSSPYGIPNKLYTMPELFGMLFSKLAN